MQTCWFLKSLWEPNRDSGARRIDNKVLPNEVCDRDLEKSTKRCKNGCPETWKTEVSNERGINFHEFPWPAKSTQNVTKVSPESCLNRAKSMNKCMPRDIKNISEKSQQNLTAYWSPNNLKSGPSKVSFLRFLASLARGGLHGLQADLQGGPGRPPRRK